MHKKFEINQTKIKGGCQLGKKDLVINTTHIYLDNDTLRITNFLLKLGRVFIQIFPSTAYVLNF